jgi:hypothetical protein
MKLLFKDIEPETLRHAAKVLVKLEENMEMMK